MRPLVSAPHALPLLALLLLVPSVAGCLGASRLDDPDAGRTTRYEAGVPSFDVEAVGRPRDGASGLDLYLGVAPASLVFVQAPGGGFASTIEGVVRLLDERGRDLLAEVAFADTLHAAGFAATRAYTPHHLVRRLDAPPGDYVVEVTLTDGASDAASERRFAATVLPPAPAALGLAGVRLEGQVPGGAGAHVPVVALHVPAEVDSLRAVAAVAAGAPTPVEVTMHLVRFRSDTAAAEPPYGFGLAGGELARQGVLFHRPDTLQRTRRELTAEGTVEMLFALPPLEPGVYGVAVEAREAGAAEPLRTARRFTVVPPGFPRIETLSAMIEALRYLATREEFTHLAAAATPEERRRRFDAFWGGLVPERARAADLLERYYSRVEEANRLFTTVKPGWKTDRGMIYILLGPPLHVDQRVEGEVWHYSHVADDEGDAFRFERLRTPEGGEGFANYVLERGPHYDRLWRRALERWRSGRAL